MEHWTSVANNMTAYDYHYKIIEEMERPENVYGENYDEHGRFYTPMRRYPRMGYEYDPQGMERYRDMDHMNGRMYYTDNANMPRMSESRYDRARRGYEESKNMNPGMDNMQQMEELFNTFEEDIKALKPKMTANEKTYARNKFTNMANMMM